MNTIQVNTSVVKDSTIKNISKKVNSEVTIQSPSWLYQLYKSGKLHFDREKLQRLLISWKPYKVNSYLTTLFNGANHKDTIQLAKIDTIVLKLKEDLAIETDAFEKDFIQENLTYFESLKGKTYLVLDGQHRIDVIVKYFDNGFEEDEIVFNPTTPILFQIEGEQGHIDVKGKYKDILSKEVKDYMFNSIQMLVVVYNTGDLQELANVFITSNSMKAMTIHEKRILNYSSTNRFLVSMCNNDLNIQSMFKTIGSGMTGEYHLDSKGDTLFMAEMLMWINNNYYENQSDKLDEALGPNRKNLKVCVSKNEKDTTAKIARVMADSCALYDETKLKKFSKSTLYNLFYTLAFFMQEGNVWGKKKDIDGKYQVDNLETFAQQFFDKEFERIHAVGTYIPYQIPGGKTKKQMHDLSFAKHNADQKHKSKMCAEGQGGSKYTFDSYARLQYLLEDISQDIEKLVKLGALKKIGTRSTSSERNQKLVADGIKLSQSDDLELDEIIPVSKGGEGTSENQQFLKKEVNRNKSDRTVRS